jgi:hypothetical protein
VREFSDEKSSVKKTYRINGRPTAPPQAVEEGPSLIPDNNDSPEESESIHHDLPREESARGFPELPPLGETAHGDLSEMPDRSLSRTARFVSNLEFKYEQTKRVPEDMPDLRILALCAISLIVLVGTAYSVREKTYLDTSNPHLAYLPHPLHETHYFASKSNFLNVYFNKFTWGWTSLTFTFFWSSSPKSTQVKERLYKYVSATATWLLFTAWFFGPALLERLVPLSGGECVFPLPSGDILVVPDTYCFTRSTISSATHPDLFATSLTPPPSFWNVRPKWMRGHDVSGHVFLLTMSTLFLADQLQYSLRVRPSQWSIEHRLSVGSVLVVIGLWLLGLWSTSVYFHTPEEKLTGYRA